MTTVAARRSRVGIRMVSSEAELRADAERAGDRIGDAVVPRRQRCGLPRLLSGAIRGRGVWIHGVAGDRQRVLDAEVDAGVAHPSEWETFRQPVAERDV